MIPHPSNPSDWALAIVLLVIIFYTGGILVKRVFWDNRE